MLLLPLLLLCCCYCCLFVGAVLQCLLVVQLLLVPITTPIPVVDVMGVGAAVVAAAVVRKMMQLLTSLLFLIMCVRAVAGAFGVNVEVVVCCLLFAANVVNTPLWGLWLRWLQWSFVAGVNVVVVSLFVCRVVVFMLCCNARASWYCCLVLLRCLGVAAAVRLLLYAALPLGCCCCCCWLGVLVCFCAGVAIAVAASALFVEIVCSSHVLCDCAFGVL